MNKKAILILSLFACLDFFVFIGFSYSSSMASNADPVHNINTGLNYTSIQQAINAPETVNGHTILVDARTYSGTLVVDKSLAIIASDRNATVIDGGGAGTIVHVTADNVLIQGFSVKHGSLGIYIDGADNFTFQKSALTDVTDSYAIYASYTSNLGIDHNIIGPNLCSGVLITNSLNFRVSSNYVHDNVGYGINGNSSINGLISENDVSDNSFDGIGLAKGCRNITVMGNNVTHHILYGIWLDSDCEDNLFYDNNIISNTKQASAVSANHWDNGLEGNYWNDYMGVDEDRNGIGDMALVMGENNRDNYPLIGTFSFFETALGHDVTVISNSSVAGFAYFDFNGTVRMHVFNKTKNQAYGFVRIRIPHALMTESYNVSVDGANPLYWNYTLYDDGNSRGIYFDYQHSEHEVLIRGTPPPDTTAPLVTVLSPEDKTYNVTEIPLVFTLNEPAVWMAFSVDGQDNITISGNTTISAVSVGEHAVVVYARDNAGNTGISGMVHFAVSKASGEPFPYWIVAVVAGLAAIVVVALVYLKKRERVDEKRKSQK